jgi:hypothetical protein
MPLTTKGKKIKSAMTAKYGEKKGEDIFYASANKGTIKGVAKGKNLRKVGQLEKLANRRSLKRRAKVELMKLATILSPH